MEKLQICLPVEVETGSGNQEIPPSFMEPKDSIPYLQQPDTNPYPKPDESNSHSHNRFL
jgi:hypothetical protein